jgi:hypothetical protein
MALQTFNCNWGFLSASVERDRNIVACVWELCSAFGLTSLKTEQDFAWRNSVLREMYRAVFEISILLSFELSSLNCSDPEC